MKLFQKLINLVKQSGINANKIELSANDILNLLAGNEINLGSKSITIKSDNFSVDKDGKMIASNAIIQNGKIIINTDTVTDEVFKIYNNNGYQVIIGSGRMWLHAPENKNALYFQSGNDYGAISLQCSNGESTDIYGNGIFTPFIKISKAGTVMYGKENGNDYRCFWTGSQLQFWVDDTNVGTLSDKRLKTEIENIDDIFVKIINEIEMKQFKVANRNGLVSFGILAQDLMEIFQKYNKNPLDYEIIQETLYKDEDKTIYYTINYEQFLILKQRANDIKFQEQQEMIEKLENRIKEMEDKLNG